MVDHISGIVSSAVDEAGIPAMLEGLPSDIRARH
jgi:hypothetical protein